MCIWERGTKEALYSIIIEELRKELNIACMMPHLSIEKFLPPDKLAEWKRAQKARRDKILRLLKPLN
ncbi:hypothetical protein MHM_03800 [Candidatus Mycoplasma haemominutum 'Birmingham 1']|uniref:Uncharacterized protein n=1 Tax=Candidatus Mycoplasma haematominutum 'Birmingham 1' TaxID=1116213 RepID=G8C3K0_9MOLU|nr:hypothetical protein MHM_03800 [Candidatus Mycoplasma haematominutum 'Birmingham 1']